MKYNKLVRDKIPEIIRSKGEKAVIHTATDREYEQKLKEKLKEELEEYLKDPDIEELADILEVVFALCEVHEMTREELEKIREDKAEKKGAFKNKLILDES